MLKIGLTGGIGSGKTRVSDILGELGAVIIDTDLIAHQLTAPGGLAIAPIREAFGAAMIDSAGALDRKAMRALVFADSDQRKRLEAIIHPLIAQEVQRQSELRGGIYQVFVVPLLVESGRWVDRVDRVCVVDCDEQTQINRVMARNLISEDTVRQVMAAQATRAQRLAAAHDVVLNDGSTSPEGLRKQVLDLHATWCNLAG